MNFDQIRGQLRPLTHAIGAVCIVVAALKLLVAVRLGIPGSPSELALVGLGLMHI